MTINIPEYVLDSFALLAYFQAELAGPAVRALLEDARDDKVALHVSLMNVGETYYIMARAKDISQADAMLSDIRALPIILQPATEDRILAAARLKAQYALSYADAFAVALGQELSATVMTGDPEFNAVAHVVKLEWLPNR